MRIIDAKWSPVVNILVIECECGNLVHHRSDRWNVRCVFCDRTDHLGALREQYVQECAILRDNPHPKGTP